MATTATPAIDAVDPREIDAALIAGLYKRTTPLLVANLGAIFLLTLALWPTADRVALLSWALGLSSWTMVRFWLARVYLKKPRPIAQVRFWTGAFAVGSGIAGVMWGCSILLVTSLEPDNAKLAVAFVMAALSASAIAGYTNSLTAFAAFLTPALLPYGARLMWLDGSFSPIIAAFVVFWGGLMWLMARHLNHGFREGLALNHLNAGLVRKLTVARDRAEAANLAKSRFLGNMSHELRTPLNAIIGYSEMMAHRIFGPLGDPKYEGYAADIHRSGAHLLSLVDRVFDLSTLEAGRADVEAREIDVTALMNGVAAAYASTAAEDGLTLHVDAPDDLPPLWGDPARLRQMLADLVSNALKFTPEGGAVRLAAGWAPGKGMTLTVSDTGVGIAPDDLARVTEPFAALERQEHTSRER
ncbi:MAG: hypothetical protein LPL00_01065, partial [Alphaproteobacteria bacterium]|nr:hypothetical protein [Alphaproteobacteria bacterium]MDX5367974.1 hypothetical protein [Alphaproteobacteria bacterium]MDX5462827.1 hypothetical protein [Alphaproteobacteria bacterium]